MPNEYKSEYYHFHYDTREEVDHDLRDLLRHEDVVLDPDRRNPVLCTKYIGIQFLDQVSGATRDRTDRDNTDHISLDPYIKAGAVLPELFIRSEKHLYYKYADRTLDPTPRVRPADWIPKPNRIPRTVYVHLMPNLTYNRNTLLASHGRSGYTVKELAAFVNRIRWIDRSFDRSKITGAMLKARLSARIRIIFDAYPEYFTSL